MNKVQKVISSLSKYSIGKNDFNFRQNKRMFRFIFKDGEYSYYEMLYYKKLYFDMIK